MKFIFRTLVVVSIFASCQNSPSISEDAPISEEEIGMAKELIQGTFDDIWGGLDSNKILDYQTKDFMLLEHGEVWNNDTIKAYMREMLARPERTKRVNTMDYISIDKYGPSIQIVYRNHAEFFRADTLAGKAGWLETALAIPTEKGWRLKMMHSTRLPRK
jgi:hypothetical protein